jgi:hypothetical protein
MACFACSSPLPLFFGKAGCDTSVSHRRKPFVSSYLDYSLLSGTR